MIRILKLIFTHELGDKADVFVLSFTIVCSVLLLLIVIASPAYGCEPEDDLTPETINFKLYKPCMSTPEGTNYCKKVK